MEGRRITASGNTSPTLASPMALVRPYLESEANVGEVFPDAVILRPSIVFGQEDDFFNRFAAMATMSPVLPLVGAETRMQPVFVGDVGRAIAEAVTDPACAGKLYELGGPAQFTFRELMQMMLAEIHRRRGLLPLPFPAAGLIAMGGDLMAGVGLKPPITTDQVAMLRVDNVVSGQAPGLPELGIAPTTLEAILPTYLYRYRRGGQFADQEEHAIPA